MNKNRILYSSVIGFFIMGAVPFSAYAEGAYNPRVIVQTQQGLEGPREGPADPAQEMQSTEETGQRLGQTDSGMTGEIIAARQTAPGTEMEATQETEFPEGMTAGGPAGSY